MPRSEIVSVELLPTRPSWRAIVRSAEANSRLFICEICCADFKLLVLFVREEGSRVEAWIESAAGQILGTRFVFARVRQAQAWAVHRAQTLLAEAHKVAQTVPIGYPSRHPGPACELCQAEKYDSPGLGGRQ